MISGEKAAIERLDSTFNILRISNPVANIILKGVDSIYSSIDGGNVEKFSIIISFSEPINSRC